MRLRFPHYFAGLRLVCWTFPWVVGLALVMPGQAAAQTNPFDFQVTVPVGFNTQNVDNDFEISTTATAGDTLRLNGNTWLTVELPGFRIGPATVLELEVESFGLESEFAAVGFERDFLESSQTSIQFAGTDDWGIAYLPQLPGGHSMTVRVHLGEVFVNRPYHRMTFIRDDDAGRGGSIVFRKVRLFDDPTPPVRYVSWDRFPLSPFPREGADDLIATGIHRGPHQAVALTGNTWAYVDVGPYTITDLTRLSFDVYSLGEVPAVLGLGLYGALEAEPGQTLQVGGTAVYGSPLLPAAAQGVTASYAVELGESFMDQEFRYLTFIRESDAATTGTVTFSNVRLFEDRSRQPTGWMMN